MNSVFFLHALEPRRLLSTYYVSNFGDDAAAGTSIDRPWRTVERVNVQRLRAGDMILFQGGQSFDGGLYVSTKEAGSAERQIIFTSYGSGRATIRSGAVAGLEVSEVAGVAVTNLNFIAGAGNDTTGIYFHAGMADHTLSSVHIRKVDVRGYGHDGVTIIASGAGSTINDVKVEQSNLHDNLWSGISVTGTLASKSHNYLIDRVRAFNNTGLGSGKFVTGNGIYVADVEDATVQRCLAFNNGAKGVAPVGIWSSGSNRITFQYNESYDNRTNTVTDGGGFDFDWDVTNSVMQYNYSHGNDGAGYMLGAGSHANSGNIIRYNVSENDSRKNGKGGIYLWGNVSNAHVYNNVVYMSAASDGNTAAVRGSDVGAGGKIPQLVWFRNNIFQTAGGAKLVNFTPAIAVGSAIAFNANAWYSSGAAFSVQWGNAKYTSLAAWRDASGEERYRGVASGTDFNPGLVNPGHGGTIGDAARLGELSAYRLRSDSRLIDRGLSQLGGSVLLDYFGETAPLGRRYDIGIDEIG